MKKLFSRIYAVYGLFIFATTCFWVFVAYAICFTVLKGDKSTRMGLRITRVWGKVLLTFLFIRVKVTGRSLLDKEQTYIYVSNHQSQLDIPATIIANKNLFRFLSKAEAAKIPVVGLALKKLYLLVDRSSPRSKVESMVKMKQSIDAKMPVHIYAEGTRTKNPPQLGTMKNGAFQLALKTKCPIAVLTIADSYKRLHSNMGFGLLPGTIHCYWSEPISTIGLKADDLPNLEAKIIEILERNIALH